MSNEPILHRITGATNDRDARFRFFILVTGALVLLAMTYGSGMRQQKKKLGEVDQIAKTYKRDLRLTQMELRVRDAHIQMLEARRQIGVAMTAVEQGNIGAADAARQNAIARLETAEASEATTLPDTRLLRERVNSAATKGAITATAAELDALLNSIAPKADFLSTVTVPPPTLNDVPQTPAVPGGEVLRRE